MVQRPQHAIESNQRQQGADVTGANNGEARLFAAALLVLLAASARARVVAADLCDGADDWPLRWGSPFLLWKLYPNGGDPEGEDGAILIVAYDEVAETDDVHAYENVGVYGELPFGHTDRADNNVVREKNADKVPGNNHGPVHGVNIGHANGHQRARLHHFGSDDRASCPGVPNGLKFSSAGGRRAGRWVESRSDVNNAAENVGHAVIVDSETAHGHPMGW